MRTTYNFESVIYLQDNLFVGSKLMQYRLDA